jgi:FkbM family methyltransferase
MPFTDRLARFGWPLRRLFRAAGLDVVAYGPTSADWQLAQAIARRGLGIALDVGANRGQFAHQLRKRGFKGVIHSFEPLAGPFAALAAQAQRDGRHFVHRLALSDRAGEAEIFVGENDQTSSLQRSSAAGRDDGIGRAHKVSGTETIVLQRLDSFCREAQIDPATCFLKLDVQGHEMKVLEGAGEMLARIPLLQLETSILPIYEGETGFGEFVSFLQARGFKVRAIRPNYFDPDDLSLSQVDLIAERP